MKIKLNYRTAIYEQNKYETPYLLSIFTISDDIEKTTGWGQAGSRFGYAYELSKS